MRARYAPLLGIVLVSLAYILGAKVGLHLAYANKNVTAVWPPTGIAVAALLLDARVWPGIAVGAWIANLWNGAGLETASLIAIGNTLAPLAAWYLIRHVGKFEASFERVPDVAAVLLLGGPLAMSISATLGTAALVVTGALRSAAYGSTWLTWWVGDAMGVVIVAPLVLVTASKTWRSERFDLRRGVEALVVLASLVGATVLAFTVSSPVIFFVLPIAAWAAVRFFQPGAVTAVVVVATTSITATVNGLGPFAHGLSVTSSLVTLQAFNGGLAVATLMLAASSWQDRLVRRRLRSDAAELQLLLRQERAAAFENMNSILSHELRNPLGAIMNSHFLVRQALLGELEGDPGQFLELAERSTQRALTLVEELLEYRRPRLPELEELELRRVIDDAVEESRRPEGIEVSVDCDSLTLQADPRQMSQILVNLIRNAVEAMGESGTLAVSGRGVGTWVEVSTADSGPGFDESVIERVFEPFFSTKRSGTGLGLAIVRRLAECHGGHVVIENRQGGGAIVRVLLPRDGRASAVPAPDQEPAMSPGGR